MARVTFFRQRQIWMPTTYGWIFLLLIVVVTSILLVINLYAFLAPSEPVGARVLVVEGWLDSWELDQGGDGHGLADGTSLLLPYYMGLYHGFIVEE